MSLICWKAVGYDNEVLILGTTKTVALQAVKDYFYHYGYEDNLRFRHNGEDMWELSHVGTEIRAYVVRYDVDADEVYAED